MDAYRREAMANHRPLIWRISLTDEGRGMKPGIYFDISNEDSPRR